MLHVKRLAHATLTTPDIERQIEYYVEVLGLHAIERSKKRAVLASRTGLEAIVLEQGEKMGLPRLAFQVAPNSDLGELAATVKDLGLTVARRSGITPGVADAITFEDPKGTLLEIFSNYDFPNIGRSEPTLSLLKLGHVAYRCHDVQRVVKFYTEALGFRISDWRSDRFAFLRCAVDHHTINFVADEQQRLHHIAFEVKDCAKFTAPVIILPEQSPARLGTRSTQHRSQRCDLSYEPGSRPRRNLRRDGPDERREPRLFRSAALAR